MPDEWTIYLRACIAITGKDEEWCWHKLSLVEGLDAQLLFSIEQEERIQNSAHAALAAFCGEPFTQTSFVRLEELSQETLL